jgi:hypothetical protein
MIIQNYIGMEVSKWAAKPENVTNVGSLVQSLVHPISRLRFETHVPLIQLKELPSGFRVLCAVSVSIDSLPSDQARRTRKIL